VNSVGETLSLSPGQVAHAQTETHTPFMQSYL
jgi:hypothetical protein